jgi:hypothetical protein
MKKTIIVNRDHMIDGYPEDSTFCAIALAVQESGLVRGNECIDVDAAGNVSVESLIDLKNTEYETIQFRYITDEMHDDVQAFISWYDRATDAEIMSDGNKMQFSFELEREDM